MWTIGSIILLMIASQMLVEGAVTIARSMGVSNLVIGLTIIAIGTSLPELAAAIAAARKGAHDMIIGNIIGSNVFNTLGVLGLTGAIQTTKIDTTALARDFPIMLLFTIAMFLFANSKGHFSRREGATMLTAYVVYICYLVFTTLK
jgi:cation:H+ antiporter